MRRPMHYGSMHSVTHVIAQYLDGVATQFHVAADGESAIQLMLDRISRVSGLPYATVSNHLFQDGSVYLDVLPHPIRLERNGLSAQVTFYPSEAPEHTIRVVCHASRGQGREVYATYQ